ncbi:hypothetical protein Tco_1402805 [Tanacetum coccineum]
MIDVYNVSHEEIREDLFATNHPSGNPTSPFSSHTNLTSPEVIDDIFDPRQEDIRGSPNETRSDHISPGNDDSLTLDAESNLLESEVSLNHDPIKDMDSILEDSVDENSLDDNLDDTISEMFTDEHALDYSPHHYGMIMMMTFLIMRPLMMILMMIHLTSRKRKSKILKS